MHSCCCYFAGADLLKLCSSMHAFTLTCVIQLPVWLQVVTQQEMLYNVNFKLQIMEVQVARAAGTRTDEETKHLNAKIAKLTEVLDGVNAEHAMLTSQVKKAEEDLSES